MARRYTRDARGRFASGGFSGQTGGRGARLMSGGRSRAGGGARIQAAAPAGAFRRGGARPSSKPTETTASRAGQVRGPKLQGVTRARLSGRKMSEGAGLRGRRRQERQQRMAIMDRWMARQGQSPSPAGVAALARRNRAEPLTTGRGTLAARASLRRSRANLADNPTAAQRGAVTRGNRYAQMAKQRERVVLGQSPAGRFVPGKSRPGVGPANSIKPTGGGIRTRGAGNAVRPYKPTSIEGQYRQGLRRLARVVKPVAEGVARIKQVSKQFERFARRQERDDAKSLARRFDKGVEGRIARIKLGVTGGKPGRKALQRRMERAASAAARGSKPARRAQEIYGSQLAGMGPGKPSKARNNLRPGPRNTKGTPKRRRKGRGKG